MTERPNWRERGYDKQYDRNHRRVLREETTCHICGKPVDKTLSGRLAEGPSVDHIVPRSEGGGNDRQNLRLAHQHCNNKRQGAKKPSRRRPDARHPGRIDP